MAYYDIDNKGKLSVSPSPHISSTASTRKVMLHVLIALMPALGVSVWVFGVRALILTLWTAAFAVGTEAVCNKLRKRPLTTGDLSAAVTGVLLAFNLPSTLPLWEAAIGAFVSIAVVKQLFGGLGQNFANPAIVGRIVLMLSFTADMTHWVRPFERGVDAVTSATPLVTKQAGYLDLFLGKCGGCLGEVSAAALLVGFIYLLAVKVITPHATLVFAGTVFVFSWFAGEDPVFQILAGGVMLGAVFMATDYVTTPITPLGKVIFGVGCGIITCVIRFYANYAEGVSFSILIMNILTPYIDRFTERRPLGTEKSRRRANA
ncbi:electron transport complex protein RnfD [Ruminococcus sp. YE71]|uniref:RnfABCDGE type electron transport complex subunit D n=1 Tax=unclassified Ruminococcus TaxID=2608920 RepID=UPI00088FC782|nr:MULTISPECIES: RnfABCDGE type electron transport complex subunit D [unclassified Ruminococcus]SDA09683.1 electron transport complex protein RnfD [Ruminococcus sp. YE78]SFW11642.1 electron transport complex protein RnfD [Ruminococcus sp. YE71]